MGVMGVMGVMGLTQGGVQNVHDFHITKAYCTSRVSKMLSEQPETMGPIGLMVTYGAYGACTRVILIKEAREG